MNEETTGDMKMTPHKDLMIGHKYKVAMRDCCIAGSFCATISNIKIGYDDGSGDGTDVDYILFDNGVVLDNFSGCIFYKIDDELDAA